MCITPAFEMVAVFCALFIRTAVTSLLGVARNSQVSDRMYKKQEQRNVRYDSALVSVIVPPSTWT